MTLAAEEFIRRFLLHTLPPGFQRIRHYGLLANAHRRRKLQLCRQQLATPVSQLLPGPQDYPDVVATLTSEDRRRCPECGVGSMLRIESLPPCRRANTDLPLPLPTVPPGLCRPALDSS